MPKPHSTSTPGNRPRTMLDLAHARGLTVSARPGACNGKAAGTANGGSAMTGRETGADKYKLARGVSLSKPLVLVGLMGSGKSSIGRRLAKQLNLQFVDADDEIEAAAGCSISDIFERFGEESFRDGERRVIARLLDGPVRVIATGGGAFMDPDTRQRIGESAITIWLRAGLEILLERVQRRDHRPLLKTGDPRKILEELIAERYPVYGGADIIVESSNASHHLVVDSVVELLNDFLAGDGASGDTGARRSP